VLPQDPLGGDDAEPPWLPALLETGRDPADPATVNLL
jgi:hypothetical protein